MAGNSLASSKIYGESSTIFYRFSRIANQTKDAIGRRRPNSGSI